MSARYIGAIDQGTTSTRFIVFDRRGDCVSVCQREHRQICPRPGWVEHDALEIWRNTLAVIETGLRQAGLESRDLAAIGITNQRETTLIWDQRTGMPLYNAIVWQDARAQETVVAYAREGGIDRFRAITGLPLASYFSALKLHWLLRLDNVRAKLDCGYLRCGTMDTWLLWNLTGGPRGGLHLTDVTNASRTLLMNLATLDWDDELLKAFGVSRHILPKIVPSSSLFGTATVPQIAGVPIAGLIGDQQAALMGQACFEVGATKNTYGTGCFLLMNTGRTRVPSQRLVTTVAYQLDGQSPNYALEGSIAVAGALVQWLRDELGLIASSEEIEVLAREVEDNGDVYFVPAFSGLFAPHWNGRARGLIVGLTRFAKRAHLARAALEATAYQTREVIAAMEQDSGIDVRELRVDGGMVVNELLMQFQADICGIPVVRRATTEMTAMGAAYAAGLATRFWDSLDEIQERHDPFRRWSPDMDASLRSRLIGQWDKAVLRSFDWAD